ncbi:hypothetical protein ACFYWO_01485 [Streptomyces sp. NPDC002932]|uniref:hypothetical protein n=1 Tax=Streptomyces sp. NPDC002932 TaxID=3364672 RepID=UPI0036B08F9A
MNSHDPAERPGAHLVAEKLGVDSPWLLTENHAPDDPRDIVGLRIAEGARDVDSLHKQLTQAAQSAAELLAPICRGEIAPTNRYGVLQSVAPQVDVLAARRGAAYDQLTRSIATFRLLVPDQDTVRREKTATRHRDEVQEAAPEAGLDTPRVSAALSRSSTATAPGPSADPPAVCTSGTAAVPSSSRQSPSA